MINKHAQSAAAELTRLRNSKIFGVPKLLFSRLSDGLAEFPLSLRDQLTNVE